jgi:selenocysteine lyase/cysteine desulfurase
VKQFDLARARAETPGCDEVYHFNNAGAALAPEPVLRAQVEHLELEARIGGYEAARLKMAEADRAYGALAELLNARPEEIALVENATRAWDMAFYSLPWQEGDRILTSEAEYASNYIAFLQVKRRSGAVVEVVPSTPTGEVDLEALATALERPAALVAVTHVPTSSGLVNPAKEIGRLTRAAGVPYLLDACQSIGQLPLDVEAIGCDMLSATSRKYLRGPRGAGMLYVRRSILERLEPPLVDLHAAEWTARDEYVLRGDAKRFENWERSVASRIGLAAAVDYALDWGVESTWPRIQEVAAALRASLAEVPGIELAEQGANPCGIVTFVVDGLTAEEVRTRLLERRVNVQHIVRVHSRLDMEARGLVDVVRASVHYYTDEGDIEALCAALRSVSDTARTG